MWPYGFVFSPRKRSDILCDALTLAAALTNLSTTSMSKQKRLSMESVFLRMQDLSLNISAWLRTRPFWKGGRHTEWPLVRIHNEVKNDCCTVLAVLIGIYTLNECTSLSAMAFRLIVNDTNLFIWAPTKPETQYCSAKSYVSFLQLFPRYLWSRTLFPPTASLWVKTSLCQICTSFNFLSPQRGSYLTGLEGVLCFTHTDYICSFLHHILSFVSATTGAVAGCWKNPQKKKKENWANIEMVKKTDE